MMFFGFGRRVGFSGAMAIAAAMTVSGCASTIVPDAGSDPLQGFNRAMHTVNKGVDTVALRPLSQGYGYVVPETIKHVINNEVRYVQLPISFANSVLQGDVERAGETFARFFVNSTLGGLGALDPATEIGIPEHSEDFGQTLAVWGVGSGPYIELPLLGPTTLRDGVARAGDYALNPLTYIGQGATTEAIKMAETPVRIVDTRYRFGKLLDDVLYETEDSYTVVKNTYLQRRRSAILNGKIEADDLPDIYEAEPF